MPAHSRISVATALVALVGVGFGCGDSTAPDDAGLGCGRWCASDGGPRPGDDSSVADGGPDAIAAGGDASPSGSDAQTSEGGPAAGVCGDGVVDSDEVCDPAADPCCNDDCDGPRASGEICRAATGECDRAEKCNGSALTCPKDRFVAAGFACGDSADGECDDPDQCDGRGVCVDNAVAAGTPCTDDSPGDCADAQCDGAGACAQDHGVEAALTPCGDTTIDVECDSPDSCDAVGNCNARRADPGTPCTDLLEGDCDDAQCDSSGTCAQGYVFEAEFTPCGNAVPDTACDAADSCDAAGSCDDRIASPGAQCVDITPTDCDDAQCDGSGACIDTYALEAANTPCGNPTDTTCTDPDLCDAAGVCQPRHASAGDTCTDTTDSDCNAARCNGSGICNQAYTYEADGTPCGDLSSADCDAADTCDTGGACQDNLADEFTQCADPDPDDCYDALCNGAGSCIDAYDLEPDGAPCDQDRGNCWAEVCCPGVTDDPDGDGWCDLAAPEDDVVFVTSTASDGLLGGLAGADALCDARATTAGLDGSYVAWLSSSALDAVDRVGDGPFVRVDGVIVANDVPDLTNASLDAPIARDELNHTLSGAIVWTGTQSNGTVDASARHCSSWTSSTAQGAYGESGATNSNWTAWSYTACGGVYRLYCIQEDCPGVPDVDFDADPDNCGGCGIQCPGGSCVAGQCIGVVFVTSVDYAGDLPYDATERGEVDGDLFCNDLAAAAALPGTYTAWLSTSRVDAVLRIADQSYALPNGALVANSLADLVDGTLLHAINEHESGAPTGAIPVWTGSLSTGLAGAETCVDWTSGASGDTGRYGSTASTNANWTSVATAACNTPRALYCFQDAGP